MPIPKPKDRFCPKCNHRLSLGVLRGCVNNLEARGFHIFPCPAKDCVTWLTVSYGKVIVLPKQHTEAHYEWQIEYRTEAPCKEHQS